MTEKQYQSPLVTRYASEEMKQIFSPHFTYKTWRMLWIALAEAEKELGLPITQEQITELKSHVDHIDFETIAFYEKSLHHMISAQIHAYADQCPGAGKIIHLGATSSFVIDNGELVQMKHALKLIKAKLILLLEKFNHLALQQATTPCLGQTHLQPAHVTTFGKRCCLWLQDFLFDFQDLDHLMATFPFLGTKGALGAQASFLALFEQNEKKVAELDQKVAEKMGFNQLFRVSHQSFPDKQQLRILQILASLAASSHKCATDLRLLSHLNEIEEPFGFNQKESLTKPYKRNPIFSERVCALARFVLSLWNSSAHTAASQWLERTLDDSIDRNLVIPEAFLATDGLLSLLITLLEGVKLFPKMMAAHLREHQPYLGMEQIIAAAVLQGKNRDSVYEKFREHAAAAGKEMRQQGAASDLLQRLAQDPEIGLSRETIEQLVQSENLMGRSKQQVIEFLKLEVEPILEKNLTLSTTLPDPEL